MGDRGWEGRKTEREATMLVGGTAWEVMAMAREAMATSVAKGAAAITITMVATIQVETIRTEGRKGIVPTFMKMQFLTFNNM